MVRNKLDVFLSFFLVCLYRIFFSDLSQYLVRITQSKPNNNIMPILCVGESQTEKLAGETNRVIHDQVVTALANVTAKEVQSMVIAYEPVWALSSGTDFMHHATPKPDEILSAINIIRHNVKELYGVSAATSIRVLYGGSVNASSAYDLLNIKGLDGLLVGGASLNYHEFSGIVDAAFRKQQEEA